MRISLNGMQDEIDCGTSIEQLALMLGYDLNGVAVAVNGTFVPRHTWGERVIASEDLIDLVVPFQGG